MWKIKLTNLDGDNKSISMNLYRERYNNLYESIVTSSNIFEKEYTYNNSGSSPIFFLLNSGARCSIELSEYAYEVRCGG
jgi:hypothetical protein